MKALDSRPLKMGPRGCSETSVNFFFFDSSPMKMGPIGRLEMSVRNQLLGFLTLGDWTDRLSRNIGKKFIFGFLTPEDGTDSLFRNVGKKLPLLAVQ